MAALGQPRYDVCVGFFLCLFFYSEAKMFLWVRGKTHWSNASHTAKLWIVNGVVFIPYIACLLFPYFWTFLLATGFTVVYVYIDLIKKISLKALLRAISQQVVGYKKRNHHYYN